MAKKYINFGEHFTLDGYGGNYEKLADRKLVEKILLELPRRLKMKRLCQPQVFLAPDNCKKDPGGWSGFVVIAESHVSLHTFPARGFLSADVYSCKNGLDIDFISDYFQKKFKLKEMETNFIKRGTKYPKNNIYLNEK